MKIVIMSSVVLYFMCAPMNAWVWTYKKYFNEEDALRNSSRTSLFFSKCDIPEFTQFIFSWNAKRPLKGDFSFYGQVRDAKTKKWHDWHKMIEWGSSKQCSYASKHVSGSSHHHVRLELPLHAPADAVRVGVHAHNGADLSCIRALFATTAHLGNFEPERVAALKQLPSVKVEKVPTFSQKSLEHEDKDSLCSPTSTTMLAGFLSGSHIDPTIFAKKAYDHGLQAYGSWPFNTAHAYELADGKTWFHVARLPSFKALHAKLTQDIPVVVSVRGPLKGAPKDYPKGHLLIVVGWDQKRNKVLCHDPAIEGHRNTPIAYDAKSFIAAWESSRRLAYVAEPA
ncbi:MAG: C39 family peptidase [Candidatus Babeliales bacterium]